MDARFIQRGDSIDFRPDRDVVAGEVVVLGNLVGVAKLDIGAGELGALALEGVFEMTRSPRYAFIGCGKVAWSERLRAVVGMTEPGAVPIGHNLRSTRIGDSTMTVRLCQGVRTP